MSYKSEAVEAMPLILGPVRAAVQTGAKSNIGSVFLIVNKNNLHMAADVNSFNQGNRNFHNSFFNAPEIKFRKARTNIIDAGNLAEILRKANHRS
ncbi:MAG: hypothetical protein HPY89_09220 [Pelotomaculum sp.]|nr:hypothetical protein [Pelotomaculum sp.]